MAQFPAEVAPLTLAADPDGLLVEEKVLLNLRRRGFTLLPFDDSIAFRYAYEAGFRSRRDRGEAVGSVILRLADASLDSLPFDLLEAGRHVGFTLGSLFPSLSYRVVASLARRDLDALYEAQQRLDPPRLGDGETKSFILRHVFQVVTDDITQPSDLLKTLLRLHYQGRRLPRNLAEHMVQALRGKGLFADWPLDRLVSERQTFLDFLQERWPAFLDQRLGAGGARELAAPPLLELGGPVHLPFDHSDVRVYVDNLFLDGLLRPVPHELPNAAPDRWMLPGIRGDPSADRRRRLEGLAARVEGLLPAADAAHQEWLRLAPLWAELTALALELKGELPAQVQERQEELRQQMDERFLIWVRTNYVGLHNQPPAPPVMLHHVPRYLARQLEANGRMALIVLDGLAMDQWVAAKEGLLAQGQGLSLQEDAVFAWLPTLTAVSRQALFAGEAPLYFPKAIRSTRQEPSLWSRFWVNWGLAPEEVGYLKLPPDEDLRAVSAAARTAVRMVAIVVDKVDRIMHGMELGTAGMHNQVRQWTGEGTLSRLFTILFNNGFQIFLVSDHGNIETQGCGRPAEGAAAELRGERVRIYSDEALRARVKSDFPDAIEWPPVGLPAGFLPLFAPNRKAFVREKQTIVAHGGISLEELVVPLIRVEGRDP
ncbi:MAG: BREX-3 system phosphatase PglZ [Thermaerobacter sp.]|nr:BREX-3 system phosphatase PglZ [Thermaerobacter sp.]